MLAKSLALAIVLLTASASCSQLFPFNINGQAGVLADDDDGCTSNLDGYFKIFGQYENSTFVCTNGLISFGERVTDFRPSPFPVLGKAFVAPFWADVSTKIKDGVGSGNVFYEIISTSSSDSIKFNQYVQASNTSDVAISQFIATRIYQVTWDQVGYYKEHSQPANSFQAAIVTNENLFFAVFNYPTDGINWLLPNNATGYPVAGANLGDGLNFINLPISGANITWATNSSNIGIPGIWVLNIGEQVTAPLNSTYNPPTPSSTPSQTPTLPYNAMVYRNYHGKSNGLGYSVSASGSKVAVAQPLCSEVTGYDKPCGKVYLLDVNFGGWDLVQYFQYLGHSGGSGFGSNVLLQDDWLLIQSSQPYDLYTGDEQSIVYGFQYSPANGRYVRKFAISPPTSQYFQYFGDAFAKDGNYTIVSSKWANTDGYSMNGIVYVYHYPKSINRVSGTRYLEVKSPNLRSYENFGQSVAAKNGILLVSTSTFSNPAVYVYTYNFNTATYVQTISPSNYYSFYFGNKIVYNGVDLFVGSYLDSTYNTEAGSVYHFVQNPDGTFYQQEILTPYDQIAYGMFGVSFDYNTEEQLLVVGATLNYQCTSCYNKGAVYTLKKSVFGYWEQTRHTLGKASGADLFGYSVTSTTVGVVVGAPYDSTYGSNRGALYFIRN